MKIDNTKSALANLIAAITEMNPTFTATPSQVTAGVPQVRVTTDATRNTVVTLSAIPGQGWQGSLSYIYYRRGLGDSVVSPSFALNNVPSGITASQVLDQLATQLGLVRTELTLTGDLTYPGSGQASTVTLGCIAGSLLYADGATQAITLNWA